jgi:glycosyltransferase involved in cell wall biosynthesis
VFYGLLFAGGVLSKMNGESRLLSSSSVDLLALDATEICDYLRSSFDANFYLQKYSGILESVTDALEHYALVGWKEGRDPCSWFSTQLYLACYSDVARQGVNPLLHYLVYGRHEGRSIWPAAGWSAGSQSQDTKFPELSTAEICESLRSVFDERYYTERYPDMAGAVGLVDPLEHYAFFGWREGRDPCEWFSTQRYLAYHSDVARATMNPLLHYVLYGQREGRRIWPVDFNGSLDIKVDPAATFVADSYLHELTKFPPRALRPPRTRLRPDRLIIHWLIPDFSAGSGGHMTIFRFVRLLEILGHECAIWITVPDQHRNGQDAYDDIVKHFQTIRAKVAFADQGFDAARGDVVVATGWQTVARALNATKFRDRCYFVQDYETGFHPMGSSAVAAEWTYTKDLGCICAGPWLSHMLKRRFGRWTRHFFLAFDRDIYYPAKPSERRHARRGRLIPRIALYARCGTARRAVELAFLALEHLGANGTKFHVDLFGNEDVPVSSPFPCTSHGILSAGELADLYRNADLGICFSTTNYSLVPQEMMACGLPVVEIDCESTRAVFPKQVVTLTGPHPLGIAADIKALLEDDQRRHRQATLALRWASRFDWVKSAEVVERALLDRLGLASSHDRVGSAHSSAAAPHSVKASICIPTLNGGPLLLQVVERLRSQRAPWPFEIVIVDSSSTDDSIERVIALAATPPTLRISRIPQSEFQHGRTRNLCASMAKGEFVAFLTQDALPTDEAWLYNIVTVLEHFPRAAGAFGRHLAWPRASPFTKRELTEHFADLGRHPLALSRETDVDRWQVGDKGWRQILHYFSDNNSCLRRSAWQRVPYPELDYGEDQAWADTIIQEGYEKVYVPSATVYHSHDYTPDEARARAEVEGFFFYSVFGYKIFEETRSFDEQLDAARNADTRWARSNGVSPRELADHLELVEARLSGQASGTHRAMSLEKQRPHRSVESRARGTCVVRLASESAVQGELDPDICAL